MEAWAEMEHLVDGFRVFSVKEMDDIHRAARAILESCGREVLRGGLLDMAGDAGIPVDVGSKRIRPTQESVLETIRQMTGAETPEITDTGAQRAPLPRRVHRRISKIIGANYGFVVEQDRDTWRMRTVTREDLLDYIKLRRALGCEETGSGLIPLDVPAEVSPIHAAAIGAKYSNGTGTPDCKDVSDMEWITRVMQASGRWDSTREFRTSASVRSPLCLVGRDADIVYHQARRGYLTRIIGVPMPGATSPCTLAGDIAQRLAETFGFLTFSRIITPPPNNVFPAGWFSSGFPDFDLRKGHLINATPRGRIYWIAWSQIQGEFYKMPGAGGTSMNWCTEASEPGIQACIEKPLQGMANLTRGIYTDDEEVPPAVVALGMMATGVAVCAEQAVLDNEIVSYLNKFLAGIRVDEDTLAVDVIKEVGPSGEFVSTDHTLRHFREVSWHSDLFHRGPFDAWVAGGRPDPLELAKERVREAMKIEVPLVISEDRARDVDRVVEEAERALVG